MSKKMLCILFIKKKKRYIWIYCEIHISFLNEKFAHFASSIMEHLKYNKYSHFDNPSERFPLRFTPQVETGEFLFSAVLFSFFINTR